MRRALEGIRAREKAITAAMNLNSYDPSVLCDIDTLTAYTGIQFSLKKFLIRIAIVPS